MVEWVLTYIVSSYSGFHMTLWQGKRQASL